MKNQCDPSPHNMRKVRRVGAVCAKLGPLISFANSELSCKSEAFALYHSALPLPTGLRSDILSMSSLLEQG